MNEHKIVLGLDFGTTFTGVAYGTTAGDFDKIEFVTAWPESSGASHKTPTKIAYFEENIDEIDEDAWGFQVNGRMTSYSWFKLLLNADLDLSNYDDLSPESILRGLLQLPEERSAQNVCEDYLKLVRKFIDELLTRRFTEDVQNTPMEVWVTVPAIWTEAAKDQTRQAAKAAGFASRPFDSIKLISEPEAAAISIFHDNSEGASIDPVTEGETFIVCDCGGGTVDLTTYRIGSTKRGLTFEEVCAGEGGKCGSTFVDRNFEAWMVEVFKANYQKLDLKSRGPGSKMMESFEKAKLKFGPQMIEKDTGKVRIENVKMKNVKDSPFYDRKEHTVIFSWKIMQTFFDPVIDLILKLVEKQYRDSAKKRCQVTRIMLAGGFGDSKYLHYRLKLWCESQERNIKLSCPRSCQAAIMRGAVIRGLLGLKPTVKIARLHYGFSCSQPFREGVDLEEDHWIDRDNGEKMAYNRIDWVVEKGQELGKNFKVPRRIERQILPGEVRSQDRIDFFSCSADNPPDFEYSRDPKPKRVGSIEIPFTKKDFASRAPVDSDTGERIRYIYYSIQVNMNGEESALKFDVIVKGRRMGSARIDFEQAG